MCRSRTDHDARTNARPAAAALAGSAAGTSTAAAPYPVNEIDLDAGRRASPASASCALAGMSPRRPTSATRSCTSGGRQCSSPRHARTRIALTAVTGDIGQLRRCRFLASASRTRRPGLIDQRQSERRLDMQPRCQHEARDQCVLARSSSMRRCAFASSSDRFDRRSTAIIISAILVHPRSCSPPKQQDRHRLHRQRSRSIRARGGAPRTEENAKARLRQPKNAKRPTQKRAPRSTPLRLNECGPRKAAPPRRASLSPLKRTGP